MPIDPAGTVPGLAVDPVDKPVLVNMRCKNHNCDSIQVTELKYPGSGAGRRMYRCVKCHTSWGIHLGGPVDI